MKFILGTKKYMTRKFTDKGTVIPLTVVEAGPCVVTQVKNQEKDTQNAVQIGFKEKRSLKKAQSGHLKDLGKFKYLKEFSVEGVSGIEKGQKFDVSVFEPKDKIKITGISKGKGFQGVVKRYGFKGSPASHGHKDQLRMPGSIGATGPARVFKGVRMGGQMGNKQITVSNLEIFEVDKENNLLYIKGAVPGAKNGLLFISAPGELKFEKAKKVETIEETKSEKQIEQKNYSVEKQESRSLAEEKMTEVKESEKKESKSADADKDNNKKETEK